MAEKILKTFGDRILVRLELPPKKVGRIELPDEVQKRERIATAIGEVLEIGPLAFSTVGMRDVAVVDGNTTVTERCGHPWCEVGDRVMFQRYSFARVPDPESHDGYVPELAFVLDRDLICLLAKKDPDQRGNE